MKSPLVTFICASLVCFATIGGYVLGYIFIQHRSVAVAELDTQIATKTESAARVASARAALSDIAEGEARMQAYFVPETGVVSFINTIETLGRTQGALVNVLSVSKTTSNNRPALTFALSVKGSFDAVMRTVGTIEYAQYADSVSTLSLSREDNKDEKKGWHAEVSLIVGSVVATSTTP